MIYLVVVLPDHSANKYLCTYYELVINLMPSYLIVVGSNRYMIPTYYETTHFKLILMADFIDGGVNEVNEMSDNIEAFHGPACELPTLGPQQGLSVISNLQLPVNIIQAPSSSVARSPPGNFLSNNNSIDLPVCYPQQVHLTFFVLPALQSKLPDSIKHPRAILGALSFAYAIIRYPLLAPPDHRDSFQRSKVKGQRST